MSLLHAATAEMLATVLDRFDDPLLVVASNRSVLFMNAAANVVLSKRMGLALRQNQLALADRSADEQLGRLLIELTNERLEQRHQRGIRVSRQSRSKDWLAIVSPFAACDGRPTILLRLIGRIQARQLPTAALKELFGLTRREIELLSQLTRDESLRYAAERMSLSHETIRAYVKRILRKCDVRSRTQLLALLQRLSMLAPAPTRAVT